MNPASPPFQYEAVAQFTGFIQYVPDRDENPGDRVELLKCQDECGDEYRIYAKLSRANFGEGEVIIEALIVEKDYPIEQSLEDFWEYVKEKINSYAYRLVGFSGDWSATVSDVFVKDKNGDQYHPPEPHQIKDVNSPYLVVKRIDKLKFCNLITAPKSEFLDEYIERCYFIENNLIKGSKIDPVLLLVSLSSLFDLIQENENNPLDENPLLKATRNLVAHAFVNRPVTVDPLKERLCTDQNVFKFSRNNTEHMKLVKEANLELYRIIGEYIQELLRDRGRVQDIG